MNDIAKEILMHYGMPKRSGRYPWGSGDKPYQHSGDFLSRVEELKKQGMSEVEIASDMGFVDPKTGKTQTTKLRTQYSLAKDERRSLDVATAKGLREKGYSLNEIAEKMGYKNDSSVRSLLNENTEARMNQAKNVANLIKEHVDSKGIIDVGVGVERELGISREKLEQALHILEMDDYVIYGGGVPQVTNPGKQTNIKVIGPPGTEHKDIYDFNNVHSITDYTSRDGGDTFDTFVYPKSMDSKRVKVRYAEEGGVDKDGLIEIRRGVEDLSLGNSSYAQVRILVDDKKYMKGMAIYSDDLPDGVDVIFNTNKKTGTPKGDVFKNITNDPDNPFGSLIKANGQSIYIDKDGKKQLSLINKRAEEGDWKDWKDGLPSQFLAKQSIHLIKKQLSLTTADKIAEYDEICSLTNPTVKKVLLQSFADDCDAAAIHLKAAALPRQKYQVLLPIPTLKDNEVYAPNFDNGEKVALIRYPHGGTFEIPVLTVNNKHNDSKRILGTSPADLVGINAKVAERLSGADFDGDAVMVIPTNSKVKITSTKALDDLKGFDSKASYGADEVKKDHNGNEKYYRNGIEFKPMKNTQTEMGIISNLITDMTIKGATDSEKAKAVKHSMVVIDAEKHRLDYKQSYIDNGIASLKKKYQAHEHDDGYGGASTLLSRAKSETSVLKRKGSPKINKETGEQSYKEVYEEYVDKKTGKTMVRMQKSTKMAETGDAFTLSSGYKQEDAYAEYANKMKSLANQARKEMLSSGKIEYSSTSKATYQREVDSLYAKLNVALKNAPKERKAMMMANSTIKAKKQDNPDMTKAELKKERQRAITNARNIVGAQRQPVKVTDKEWEAIQSGAISENKLYQILNNTDIDELRQRATPRSTRTLSDAKINKIKTMKASGYSNADIAKSIGVSASTVSNHS